LPVAPALRARLILVVIDRAGTPLRRVVLGGRALTASTASSLGASSLSALSMSASGTARTPWHFLQRIFLPVRLSATL
jgi:hypothetical protein